MSNRGEKQDAAASGGHPAPPSREPGVRRWRALGGVLSVAAVGLLLLAPAAFAAPPANDLFENATPLTEDLPIEAPGTNVEAMKEEGEPFIGFGAGHTVWYEWEATGDGWVTIGACERQIETALGVFTGEAVNALTKVVDGNASEGPHCPFGQREYTFNAISGTVYKIAIDGSGFSFPGGPKPVTEGTFELRIEETPPPANDDFANATSFVTQKEEEFEGQVFYFGSRFGYNWNATEEAGEPNHVGGPHGASVWYSWTAPVTGEAKISAGFFSDTRMSGYRGSSLNALDLMFGGIGPAGGTSFMAEAGTTYKFAIYGLLDESSGEPEMSSFQFNISMRVPVKGSATEEPPASTPKDTASPDTAIARRLLRPAKRRATFFFRASEPGSTFRCKLDKRAYAPCASPKEYRNLSLAPHVLKVVAVDATGNVDPFPAVARFRIPKPAKRR